MSLPYAEVIGDPVAHSKSPLIHDFWLAKLGIAAEYRKTHVRSEELAAFLAERRRDPDWRGCNVTVPHKEAVMRLIDEHDDSAFTVGAANTIVRSETWLVGHNTDAAGFLEPLTETVLSGSDAAIIGAGGAALAVIGALKSCGIAKFMILNRTIARADDLIDDLGLRGKAHAASLATPPCGDLLVNASSLGMTGQPPLEVDLSRMPSGAFIYDIVYAPNETPLLAEARARGMRTVDGLQMLVGQAAAAFALFFGVAAPREHDAELRALLTA